MIKKYTIFAFAAVLSLCSCCRDYCRPDGEEAYGYSVDGSRGRIELQRLSDSLNVVLHLRGADTLDRWEISHPVYRFECADLTGDAVPEIVVGVEKSTRYRPDVDRRLFIFHLFHGKFIRPLWLGSRVGAPLVDFRLDRSSEPARVHTWETLEEGTQVQRLYVYDGFGLKYYSTL